MTPRPTIESVRAEMDAETRKLRDEFAMAALTGLLADPNPFDTVGGETVEQAYAEAAYSYADAMLAERAK